MEQPRELKLAARVRGELSLLNQSAVASLNEGFEETLTIHRLGLFKELGQSFKTTNCIENLNSLLAHRTGKVDCWRNSEQKHRWLATAILDIEPRFRKVVGYRHLTRLRTVLQSPSNRTGKAVAYMIKRSRSGFQLEKGLTPAREVPIGRRGCR